MAYPIDVTFKSISLTLTANYASTWKMWEGVRELVQNWHDGVYQTADKLDFPVSSDPVVQFSEPKQANFCDIYEAYAEHPKDGKRHQLGLLCYDRVNSRLQMVNRHIALHKRILLMGYSNKANKKETIGQFGEGLKVGALALVREGRLVTMETNKDRWRFDLQEDPNFQEKVLAVYVTGRTGPNQNHPLSNFELDAADTCTTVHLKEEEWKQCVDKFLFLKPPVNCVKTELGTLLLDPVNSGQLYVKGVWVSDLTEEDLSSGVDFISLQIDRDRNAVPKPSEIDHLVSCMWIKVLEKDPSKAQQYYHLLKDDKHRDVRHACQYTSSNVALLMANLFSLEYGEEAFPVSNQATEEELDMIKKELQRKVVLCNQTLLDILYKSGQHMSVVDALAVHRAASRTIIPFSTLSTEHRQVLQHAVCLAQMAEPTLSLACISVVDHPENVLEPCKSHGSFIDVPRWFLDLETTHHVCRLCSSQVTKCMCREVHLCHNFLQLRRDMISKPVQNIQAFQSYLPYRMDHPLMFVLTQVSQEVCEQAKSSSKFCQEIHNTSAMPSDQTAQQSHKICEERESFLQQEISKLEQQIAEISDQHRVEYTKLQQELQTFQQHQMSDEIQRVNIEQQLKADYEKKLKGKIQQLEEQIKRAEDHNLEMARNMNFEKQQREKSDKKLQELHQAMDIKEQTLFEEVLHWIEEHNNRTRSLQEIFKENLEGANSHEKVKFETLCQLCDTLMEDLQVQRFVCSICKIKKKDCAFQPCGHYQACAACADHILTTTRVCPVCNRHLTNVMKIYE